MEYERQIYQATTRDELRDGILHKAACLQALGLYDKAAATLERTNIDATTLPKLVANLYLSGQYEKAANIIEDYQLENDTLYGDMLLVYILTLNELHRYDESLKAAQMMAAQHEEATGWRTMEQVNSIYRHLPKQKSETAARWLSMVPGLGHIYAGYPLEGITAFIINGAALGFGVWQVMEKCYFTAYFGGAGLLSSTFPGNQRSAVEHVKKRNFKRNNAFNQKAKERLLILFQ